MLTDILQRALDFLICLQCNRLIMLHIHSVLEPSQKVNLGLIFMNHPLQHFESLFFLIRLQTLKAILVIPQIILEIQLFISHAQTICHPDAFSFFACHKTKLLLT